jgi:hypothetical protein
LKEEFAKRKVKVIALSVDSVEDHKGWIKDINETQNCTVNYPLIADPDKKVAQLYDMIHPNALNNLTVRSVFVIPAVDRQLPGGYPGRLETRRGLCGGSRNQNGRHPGEVSEGA